MAEGETKIQEHIKDGSDEGTDINKTELLEGLKNLEPKDIAESLNKPEKKNVITDLIKTPVEEAIQDFKDKEFKNLTGDEKDLLVLSSRLSGNNQESFNALIKQDNSLDETMYDSIAQTEFDRLYPPKQEEVVNSVEDLEISSIDGLKLYGGRNGAPAPTPENIIAAVNKITDADKKTKIKTLISESAKFYKDSDFVGGKNKIIELQTYLINDCDCTLYGKNDGKDGMFGMGTYNAIFNLGVTQEKDLKDPMLSEYKIVDDTKEEEKIVSELGNPINKVQKLKDIPNSIEKGEQYRIYNYKNDNDLVLYDNSRFFIGKDSNGNDIKGNRSKTENGLTVLKYDNGNIESDGEFIDGKNINYLILKDILSTVENNQEYGITKNGSIIKGKQIFKKDEWPAGYFVSNGILHKNVKPGNLTYSTKFIYNENSKSFEETHEYLAGNYTVKEKYRNII